MCEDTVRLLGDCAVGIEMALSGLEQVIPEVEDVTMQKKLLDSAASHRQLRCRTQAMARQLGGELQSPPAAARSMARLKISGYLALRPGDSTAASLIANGCDVGVRSLSRSRNRHGGAEPEAISLAQELIRCEEQLSAGMRPYL